MSNEETVVERRTVFCPVLQVGIYKDLEGGTITISAEDLETLAHRQGYLSSRWLTLEHDENGLPVVWAAFNVP